MSLLAVLYTLSAVASSLVEPAAAAMVADLIGRERRGTGYGLHALAGGLGATLGPLVGGWVYDTIGQAVPFYLDGAVLCASAVWVWLMLKPPSPRATEM